MFSIEKTPDLIKEAERRIRPHIRMTPVIASQYKGKTAFLKMENMQHTGSFKARGSLNKIMSLNSEEKGMGIITASTGNHALGVARALQLTGTTGTIFLPDSAKQAKTEKLKNLGVPLEFVRGGPLQSELTAKSRALEDGAAWVSPYNDIAVIAGQGTIGLELLNQVQPIRRMFITVGGGGLISGVASIMKHSLEHVEIIGCVPTNSPEMMLSVEAGKVIHLDQARPTLSDGSAGGAEDNSITFEFCKSLVDRWVQVTEEEIAHAMRLIFEQHSVMVEGSAGVAYAAWAKSELSTTGDVIIICGGNIEEKDFLAAIK